MICKLSLFRALIFSSSVLLNNYSKTYLQGTLRWEHTLWSRHIFSKQCPICHMSKNLWWRDTCHVGTIWCYSVPWRQISLFPFYILNVFVCYYLQRRWGSVDGRCFLQHYATWFCTYIKTTMRSRRTRWWQTRLTLFVYITLSPTGLPTIRRNNMWYAYRHQSGHNISSKPGNCGLYLY